MRGKLPTHRVNSGCRRTSAIRSLGFACFKNGRLRQNRSWSRSEPVWKETKNYGKYLYLLGRAEAALGNYGDAEQIYRSALENLKKFGLSSTEALTRDRLAQLLMKLGRKEEACVEWARALKLSETVQAVRLFEDITKRYVNQVKAEDLLPIIEECNGQTNGDAVADRWLALETWPGRRPDLAGNITSLLTGSCSPSGTCCVVKTGTPLGFRP